MADETLEPWQQLCELATREQDPDRLMELIRAITRLLDEKGACRNCESDNCQIFNGENAIHFPGLDGLHESIVWVFPKLLVCLNCGFTEFTVPARELSVLIDGKPVAGAIVLDRCA